MSPAEPLPDDALQVAVAGRPHGVSGEIRLVPTSGVPDRLRALTLVWLRRGDDDPTVARRVVGLRLHGGAALTRLEGIEDRTAASRLTGSEVWASAAELPAWGPGTFAAGDVIGAMLHDEDREVGRVVELVENAGRDYLEVETDDGRRILVPAVKDWLVEANLPAGRIVMRLPEGLVDS